MFRRQSEEGKARPGFLMKKAKKTERKTVKRAPIDNEESCWICFDEMKADENLTYCKYG